MIGRPLLHPRSVAIVGASDDPAKTTGRPLHFLMRGGFAGTIYPVNPRRDTVMGRQAWPSVADLPETPDHVFVLTGNDMVPDVLRQCAARGVPLVTLLAGGYGEEGEEGLAREAELRAIIAGSGTRLLGPSSIGLVNVHNGLVLTANAAFSEAKLPAGGLFVASHSGSMIGAILSRGIARGVGFAGFVSTGTELDLSLGELCEATLDDPAITGYALFLESIRHGAALRRFAFEAARRGKPIVAYKLGRSRQAADLAQSHTGAIAGEDGVADAFLKGIGVARVETVDALIEAPALLTRLPAIPSGGRKPRIGIVTTTGGGAALVVDQLGLRDIEVALPADATVAALGGAGIAAGGSRIVDLTLAGTRPDVMQAALDVMLAAPEFDLVVAVAGSSARFQPHLLVPAIIAAARAPKPLVAFAAPDAPDALASLSEAGIPAFRTPESCADAIAAVFGRRAPRRLPDTETPPAGKVRQLDEAEGYRVLAALGVPAAPHAVVDASAASCPIPYPVAVKLLSAEIAHKTELGGVAIGIADDAAFAAAAARIGGLSPRLLVQAMAPSLGEVLIGFTRDPDAGPMVMLAAGGILAELADDRALRLAPVDRDEAAAMIAEVRLLKALDGYRGRPRGDLGALADAIVALSRAGPEIVEAEINPLMVAASGVAAVDALVRVREGQA